MTALPNKITKDDIDRLVAQSRIEYAVFGNKLTVAVITLPSNYKVTGEASCVDANNFNKALGEKYALENAVEKLWGLEGYLLAEHLHRRAEWLANQTGDIPVKCTAPQDPDHVLTADEIKRLAETGSLCDCMEVVDYGEREHPIKEGDHVDFGTALHLMELGERVQRAGWNGKGMFVYQVPAASYPAQRNAKGVLVGDYPEDMVPYAAYLALKTVSGEVVPWTISQSDALATDWMLHASEISESKHMTDEQVNALVNEGIVITSDCFELDGNEYFSIDMALSLIESDEIACQRAESGVVLTIDDVAANDWQIVDTPKSSHVTRLNVEVNQVQDRLDKLSEFLLKGKPAFVTDDDWALLREQQEHMSAYRAVLVKRANLANRH